MTIVLAFGDSITQGYWDFSGGWVQKLKSYLDKRSLDSGLKEYYSVYNLGVDGDSSRDLVGRIAYEIKHRIKLAEKSEKIIILVAIGSNDSAYDKKMNNSVPLDEFKKNVRKIADIGIKYGEVVFIGSPPVDESFSNPLPWLKEFSMENNQIIKYDDVLREICLEKGLEFIDIYKYFIEVDYPKLFQDGVHPNIEGHELMFKNIMDAIKSKIIEQ